MSKLIQYKAVEICQEEQIVLKDVNIEVTSGEMVYLLGRVGTGKSSFMKTLYAEVEPIGVQAEVLGYDMLRLKRKDIPHLRRKVGVVLQDFQLLTDRSVEENLELVSKYGITQAPTLVVVKDGLAEVYANASNIIAYIGEN